MDTLPLSRTDPGVGRSFLKLATGEAAARLIAFGATVYMARTLGASVYGVIVLATTVLLYLSVLTDCGVEALGIRNVAADPESLLVTLPSILGARLVVAAMLIGVTAVAGLVLLPQPDGAILAAYVFTLGPVALGTRWVHLGFERPGHASIGRVLSELTSAAIIIALVHGPGDLGNIPVAQLAGEGIGAIVLFRLLPGRLRRLRVTIHPRVIRELFGASWPLILNALLGLAIFNSDFLFLRGLRDSAAVGLYAAAYTVVSFFLNLGAGYTMSLLPAMTRLQHDVATAKQLYDRSMVQVLAGAIPVAIGGALVAVPLMQLLFGAHYVDSALPLRILVWSIPAALIRNVGQGVLIARGRQDQLLRTAAWAAAINIVLNIALIAPWGLAGAAIATLATELLRTVMVAAFVTRLGITMTPLRRFWRVLVATGVMAACVSFFRAAFLPLDLLVGLVSYAGALTLLGGLRFHRGAWPEIMA